MVKSGRTPLSGSLPSPLSPSFDAAHPPEKVPSRTSRKKAPSSFDPASVNAVIARLKLLTGSRTLEELAAMMGLSPKDFALARKKGVIPDHWVYHMRLWMKINPNWLLRGEGPEYEGGYTLSEMMRDMETCPIIVTVHRPFWTEEEPGNRFPKFPVRRRTVLPRVYVPDGLLVFEQEPTPGLPEHEDRTALIGVDTRQTKIECACSFAFYFKNKVEFWRVGPLGKGDALSQQECREDLRDRYRFIGAPSSFGPTLLGKVIWRFESVWRYDLPLPPSRCFLD